MPKSPTGSPSTPARTRWRLVLLTVAVLLGHWALLRSAPLALGSHASPEATDAWAFATRTIAAPAPAPAARPVPVAVRPAHTAPVRVQAGTAPAPAGNLFPTDGLERNPAPALADTGQTATETIANQALASNSAEAAPTPPAAAVPAAPKPLPAKAARSYVFPPSARLKYAITGEVKGFPYYVNGELQWKQDGKTYDARMEISHFLLGSRVQTSTGELGPHGLEPTRFGDKVKSEVAAHFEREKGKITFSANTPDAPLLAGAQDQLSIFMQVAAMLAGDPGGFPPGSTLSFQAVGPRSADTWVFTVGASEKLSLPGGELVAVHLWRDPSGDYDPKTEIWLAPELGYLPVRIRLTQRNGDFVDQQWKSTQK